MDLDAVLDVLFLLPLPKNARVLLIGGDIHTGPMGRAASRSVTLITAAEPECRYDVVFSLHRLLPARRSLQVLRQLADYARSGGLVVVSFENPLQLFDRLSWTAVLQVLPQLLAHHRVRRLMDQVSLRWGEAYGVFPSWRAPRELVPLEDSAVMTYYLNQRVFPSTARWRAKLLRPFLWGRVHEALLPGYLVWGTRE